MSWTNTDCVRRSIRWPLLVLATLWGTAPRTTTAQSLWPHRVPQKSHMFLDTQARQVGDIVTIVIREMTDVENRDQKEMDRSRKRGGKFGLLGTVGGVLGSAEGDAKAEIGVSSSRGYDGSTATTIEREFQDRITARVVEVHPNGNLRIEGYRRQLVSRELRELRVTGWVRPWDIRADNSVESRQVADLCLEYHSQGEETDFTRLGWFRAPWTK